MSNLPSMCRHCGLRVMKGAKCINCFTIYHPGCISALRIKQVNDDEVICCDKEQKHSGVRIEEIKERDSNANQIIIDFLKSEEFSNIVKAAVDKANDELKQEINKVQSEVQNLKLSNIELVRFLSKGFAPLPSLRYRFSGSGARNGAVSSKQEDFYKRSIKSSNEE